MFDVYWVRAVTLVSYLNKLAKAMKNGLHPFSECHADNYDDWHDGLVYVDRNTHSSYPLGTVIADKLIDECHHDIISSYESVLKDHLQCDVKVRVEGLYEHVENPQIIVLNPNNSEPQGIMLPPDDDESFDAITVSVPNPDGGEDIAFFVEAGGWSTY